MVFRNKVILCNLWTNGRPQTRGCITTQVHKKMVKRQLTMRPSVPRPGDSSTQPTNACAVGGRLKPHSEQVVRFIAADHVFGQSWRNISGHSWQSSGNVLKEIGDFTSIDSKTYVWPEVANNKEEKLVI